MTDARELEQRYRQLERRKEVPLETRVRRGQVGLLLALILSVLLASVTAAVDLRRLQSPLGTAQSWTEATVFGDCDRHLDLSVPTVRRGRAQACRALEAGSAVARMPSSGTRVTTRLRSRQGRTAVVVAERTGRDAELLTVELQLRRRGDGWVVVRDASACRLGCG